MDVEFQVHLDHFYMSVTIATVSTAVPEYYRDTKEVLPFLDSWLADEPERKRRKAEKIFKGAGVDRRYSIMHPEQVFSRIGFGGRNDLYKSAVTSLAAEVLETSLNDAGWEATELDYIITVSCTGIMIPSVDAFLINKFGMRQDIVRLPVTEMGCVAGVSALIYAQQFLEARPGSRAAVIAVEAPTATFQLDDTSMANIVSAAIFGDGASCVLLESGQQSTGPRLVGHGMYHFPDTERMMGFDVVDSGLQMVLDKQVPETITEHFPKIVNPFLEKHGLDIADLDHLVFHPGGRKIVQTVEKLFAESDKNIDNTKAVLREYGNMSSATVLFVLARFIEQQPKSGSYGLMLSFGPGFTAQRVLLQW